MRKETNERGKNANAADDDNVGDNRDVPESSGRIHEGDHESPGCEVAIERGMAEEAYRRGDGFESDRQGD